MFKNYRTSLFSVIACTPIFAGTFGDFACYNPTILQIGAFEGDLTNKFSTLFPYGTIYAFEPDLESYKILLSKTQNQKNVNAYNLAVNTSSGSCLLYGTKNEASLFKSNKGLSKEVECINLDDWCSAKQIEHIDHIYLDVNGFEYEILKTSPQTLKKTFFITLKTFSSTKCSHIAPFSKIRVMLKSHGFDMVNHVVEMIKDDGLKIKVGEAFFMKDFIFTAFYK
ncbi:MAG: FkbM family methyltransferase [Chlamydiae bacterium]|nr:FkbM family methyltransferase [Chlamydiota bacterium]